ncbi:aspartate:alanine exchanger family transporter [Pyxidicoccus sp. MSG2]|uniref:aspartate:alanine exchanger family transporter n=1 Tax=Pyxidicoccus sp. MSG2 TaxID=2996790 RepID=UPI002270FE55|nr:TrkA C-terminal domain-containing protein [Pyxidicoccus sp. MSG2]MCY1020050.1 hypothetical protein [Pyxidicoccus sp. MSG2]
MLLSGLLAPAFVLAAEEVAGKPRHGFLGRIFALLGSDDFTALFLVVALGYLLGRVRIRRISLGTTAATLVVGLALSLVSVSVFGVRLKVDPFVQTLFFNFFMYAVGLRVGPQFFAGLERDGKRFVLTTLVVCVVAPALAILCGLLFRLPGGAVAGTLAGGMTASAALGAAQSAVTSGAVPGSESAAVGGNLAAAFAITYILSMIGFVLLVKYLPRMFHRNLEKSAEDMEKELGGDSNMAPPGTDKAFEVGYIPLVVRAYRIDNPKLDGVTVAQVREVAPRVSVERVRRGGRLLTPGEDFTLRRGDDLAVAGDVGEFIRRHGNVGPEVDDAALRDVPLQTVECVVTNKELAGQSLRALAPRFGGGLYLDALFRMGEQLPMRANTVLKVHDVLRVTGPQRRLDALAAHLGVMVRPSLATDIVTLAVGLVLGALAGMVAVPVKGIHVGLGTAAALLLAGVVIGTLRARNPSLGGPVPEAARSLLEDLGLAIFIAALSLNSGPAVAGAIQGGTLVPLILSGLVVGLLPPVIGYAVGLYVFKLNPAVLLGAVCGARCNTAGLKVAQDEAHSAVPAIGFAVPTALGTVLITIAAYLLVVVR